MISSSEGGEDATLPFPFPRMQRPFLGLASRLSSRSTYANAPVQRKVRRQYRDRHSSLHGVVRSPWHGQHSIATNRGSAAQPQHQDSRTQMIRVTRLLPIQPVARQAPPVLYSTLTHPIPGPPIYFPHPISPKSMPCAGFPTLHLRRSEPADTRFVAGAAVLPPWNLPNSFWSRSPTPVMPANLPGAAIRLGPCSENTTGDRPCRKREGGGSC